MSHVIRYKTQDILYAYTPLGGWGLRGYRQISDMQTYIMMHLAYL
jgi:hypothetical protein